MITIKDWRTELEYLRQTRYHHSELYYLEVKPENKVIAIPIQERVVILEGGRTIVKKEFSSPQEVQSCFVVVVPYQQSVKGAEIKKAGANLQ